MTKYAQPGNYTARHTGKSGYVSVQPRGGAPIPYSFIEEMSSNLYPEARRFVPKNLRGYTDSYYDLRNRQYKYWFDKWGKPHINKWWRQQLEYGTILSKTPKKKETTRKFRNTRPQYNWRYTRCKHKCSIHNNKSQHSCWRKCDNRYRRSRQGQNHASWSSYRYSKPRYFRAKYYR